MKDKFEIRDHRDKEWFWLDNQYLNGYAKILGVYCTVVYLSLCRHADNKTQQCFPSMKLIAEENGMSIKTVERSTKTLEEWGIIKVIRSRKDDGTQANNVYTLTSKRMWKCKPTDSQSIGSRQTHSPQPTDSDDFSRQTGVLHNKTHNTNKTHIVANATFSFEEELDNLKNGTRNDYKIIALYWKKQGFIFENREQFNSALKRELRPANALKGYTGEQIARAMKHCVDNYKEVGWTLETVGKRIASIINKK